MNDYTGVCRKAEFYKGRYECKTCNHEYFRRRRILYPEFNRNSGRKFRLKLKRNILEYYSGGVAHCAMCGEKRLACLSIDHINGGGLKHLKSLGMGRGGLPFYLWLKKNDFPLGYRVLCMNCQFIIRDEREWGTGASAIY